MQLKRTLTLAALGGAVVVWIAAGATSGVRSADPVAMPKPQAVDVSSADLSAEISRLRDRLKPAAAPLHSRDLFRYGARRANAARASAPAVAAVVDPPAPAVPALPPLKLVGLAEDAGETGPVRTAILSGFGDVFLVKAGDVVIARYRVETVSADAVELADLGAHTTVRLQLR